MSHQFRKVLIRLLVLVPLVCIDIGYSSPAVPESFKLDPVAAGMSPVLLARIPARMKDFVDRGTASGFVTLVARHGHIASLEAVGYQDREAKIAMRTDTIFRIMSMTKSLTVAGVMILADQSRIGLLDPVEQYLPEYRGMKVTDCPASPPSVTCGTVSAVRRITVPDLMTHTSGLPPQGAANSEPFKSLAERVSAGARVTLLEQPGTKWIYSQIGYAALGRLIEVASGESYEGFLEQHIFKPLGMKDTCYFLPAAKRDRLAVLYTLDSADKLVRDTRTFDTKIPAPESGALSTAGDMARFYQMLLNRGTLHGTRILSVAAVEAMTTNQTGDLKGVEFSPGLGMGLSFGVVKDVTGTFRYQSIGAFSKGGAFRTYGWGDPVRDMLGIILFQRTNGGGDTAPEINTFSVLANAAIQR